MFNNILMVCIGNICRSPTAEYLLKHKLAHKPGLTIHSAGLGALVDKPIDPSAGQLLSANGVDASGHAARQVTAELLLKADLILVMEQRHVKGITELAPQVSGKTFLLGKWSQNQAVPDPYRKSMEAFEHVYGQIDQFTNDWLKYL
ncbi:low molecular weight protein-tyrosine-phosphatase [Zhongshania aliphaticivorans]|jgi:protein-tyrosine phosphatase|uniref:protein-tyrosine-phosphatase n=1 Tax=Zhongshania aliphaticivorans TaxID=1470434 RepID=A0A127M1C4_9GAMM|nr:low molecular weight protein-tyrosine-phosphatase [Zhongshania aliphaticivorans]AMO67026.1 phosphotyrosine protein phosphatase [Zhongshania aliphaticivorans]|tara:strand:- start:2134 stop:2571 length:438 start_codon:yes stop_codon:yes gene_type:complete